MGFLNCSQFLNKNYFCPSLFQQKINLNVINAIKFKHFNMKIFLSSIIFFFSFFTIKAQVITQTYRVNGNCNICKKNIETAVYGEKGIIKAKWNADSLALTVIYDTTKTKRENILQRVANVGYDNESVKANDAAYSKLHTCCQYDRNLLAIKKGD